MTKECCLYSTSKAQRIDTRRTLRLKPVTKKTINENIDKKLKKCTIQINKAIVYSSKDISVQERWAIYYKPVWLPV